MTSSTTDHQMAFDVVKNNVDKPFPPLATVKAHWDCDDETAIRLAQRLRAVVDVVKDVVAKKRASVYNSNGIARLSEFVGQEGLLYAVADMTDHYVYDTHARLTTGPDGYLQITGNRWPLRLRSLKVQPPADQPEPPATPHKVEVTVAPVIDNQATGKYKGIGPTTAEERAWAVDTLEKLLTSMPNQPVGPVLLRSRTFTDREVHLILKMAGGLERFSTRPRSLQRRVPDTALGKLWKRLHENGGAFYRVKHATYVYDTGATYVKTGVIKNRSWPWYQVNDSVPEKSVPEPPKPPVTHGRVVTVEELEAKAAEADAPFGVMPNGVTFDLPRGVVWPGNVVFPPQSVGTANNANVVADFGDTLVVEYQGRKLLVRVESEQALS